MHGRNKPLKASVVFMVFHGIWRYFMKFHGVVSVFHGVSLIPPWPFSPAPAKNQQGLMPLGFTLESQDQHHQKPWPRGKGFRYVASVQTHVQTHELIRSFRCVWWKRLQQCKLQHTHTHTNTPPILQRSPGRASHSTNCRSVDCRSQQKGHHRSTREGSRWPTKALAKALAGSATSCIINNGLLNKFNTGNHGSMLSNKTWAWILPHLCDPPPASILRFASTQDSPCLFCPRLGA